MPAPRHMQAWRIHAVGSLDSLPEPLKLESLPVPQPGQGELLVRVAVCGVCHTELDEIEGRTPPPRLPVTPGHQVIGEVVGLGPSCRQFQPGDRIGVAWIHSSCRSCRYCRSGQENLCARFSACGRDHDGGYAQFMTVTERYAHPLPTALDSTSTAPLLCAGAVGLRAIRLCALDSKRDAGQPIGLTGFGASGHLVLQMLHHLHPESPTYVFARNAVEQRFARELGATWAGDTDARPPRSPVAIIDTTPAWKPVLAALAVLQPGGRLVINAIAKEARDTEAWLQVDYPAQLWREKILRTVANVTRRDVRDVLQLAAAIPLRPDVQIYPFSDANRALRDLRTGAQRGARVLQVA